MSTTAGLPSAVLKILWVWLGCYAKASDQDSFRLTVIKINSLAVAADVIIIIMMFPLIAKENSYISEQCCTESFLAHAMSEIRCCLFTEHF